MKQEIIKQIKDAVIERLGDGYEVEIHEVLKNNDTKLTGMTIKKVGHNVAPTIYLDKYVDTTEGELMSAADDIVETYRQHEGRIPENDVVQLDKEKILNGACIWLVNAERNSEILKTCPHTLLLDLAVTYRLVFDHIGDGMASCLITNQMMECYGITLDELEAAAGKNADKYQTKTMREIMIEMNPGMAMLLPDDPIPMYVITNESKLFGATVLAYKDELKRLADSLNSDLYILPSSVHEIIAVPTNAFDDLSQLQAMVPEVNNTQVQPDEVLSDQVYRYTRETDVLEVAA